MAVSSYKSQIFFPSLNSIPKLNGPRNCFFTHPILHTNQLIRHTATLVSAFRSTVSESSTQKISSFNEVWIWGCFILCLFVILASGFYWFLIFFFFWLLQLIETLMIWKIFLFLMNYSAPNFKLKKKKDDMERDIIYYHIAIQ